MAKAEIQISGVRYCLTVLATGLTLIAAVAVFNALIDPFAMYHDVGISGLNAYKPSIYNRVRLYKAFELRRLRPQAIILGTSRSHVGISCSHKAWTQLPGPCYNLAFDGATTREMFHYLAHSHAIRPLRLVVLGLDAYQATPAQSFTRADFDPLILRDTRTPAWWRYITGDLRLLASLDSFTASFDTLRSQATPEPSWFAASGQRLGEVFFRRPGENFVHYGPRAYFDEIDRLEIGFQTQDVPVHQASLTAPAPPPADSQESSLAYIRRIIQFCRQEGIELKIFITPSHVHQLEIAAATGAWPAIENGKRALVRLLAEDAAQHPGELPISLIDFSGYSSVTTEALPPPGSWEEMHYYWDSSHFKEIVGNYILDRLFAEANPSAAVPHDFGVRLSAQGIEAALVHQRTAQTVYRQRFPEDVAALRSLVRSKLHGTPAPMMSDASVAN